MPMKLTTYRAKTEITDAMGIWRRERSVKAGNVRKGFMGDMGAQQVRGPSN